MILNQLKLLQAVYPISDLYKLNRFRNFFDNIIIEICKLSVHLIEILYKTLFALEIEFKVFIKF